ncbi:MAG: OmpA family protein [Phycisphaeraceae bacterium]|nr:OmpA family protein [Phycisphaeraceae bacterium]
MAGNAQGNSGGGDHGHAEKGHGGGHRKKHHPHGHAHHEEHEEGWIVSFADNVLLQMGFFVILLALNLGPKGGGPQGPDSGTGALGTQPDDMRMIDFAIEVRRAFNSPVDMKSTRPEDQPLIRRLQQRGGKAEDGVRAERREVDQAQYVRAGDPSSLGSMIAFDDHSSTVSPGARTTLEATARRLVGSRSMVEVRGHASAAESRRDSRAARDLSYARAYAAAEILVQGGMDWRQLRLVSSGETDPATRRPTTRSDHRGNQRVEIVVLDERTPPEEFTDDGSR